MSELRDTYTILEQIGKGGGSTVYKAYHKRLQQVVVLKRIKDPVRASGISRQEVDLLKGLNHTHLPHVIDYLETEEGIFTVMNFVEGKNLRQLMAEGRTFTKAELLRWTKQLLSALDYLHSQKPPIIHGDIKPSNIILQPDGSVCLIDFNVSFLLDQEPVLGYSNGYSSPEQYHASNAQSSAGAIDQRSDLYSLGATLYHLATGKQREDRDWPLDTDKLATTTGQPFAQIIVKAADPDPAGRYPSARAMLQAIEELPLQTAAYQKLLKDQKRRFRLLCIAAVVCLLAGIGGFGLMQQEKTAKYDSLVDAQKQCIEEGKYQEEADRLAEAAAILPDRADAYYWHAASLYQQGKYEACKDYISGELLGDVSKDLTDVSVKDALVLSGLSSIELKEYDTAVGTFKKAEDMAELTCDDLRSYAAALAYDEQYEKAKQMLTRAEKAGADKAGIAYTRGEIRYAEGDDNAAISNFEKAIAGTKDDHMKMRAYLMLDKIYTEQGMKSKCREVLRKACKELPAQKQYPILERLAQANIDLREYSEAAESLQEIIDRNWATWQDYDTLASVYYMKGDLAAMKQTLRSMDELDFDRHYRVDMWRALAAIKAGRYDEAAQWYQSADAAYQACEKGNEADHEMQILYQEYQDLQEGGWL